MTSLKSTLKGSLRRKVKRSIIQGIPSSFDVIGDIAVFNKFPIQLVRKEKLIARTLMSLHKNVKVVLKKIKPVSGKYRTQRLKVISGELRKETTHKESGCLIRVNVEKCYFSPRLSGERLRIAKMVQGGERILVLFSGVGVYPCVIAKNSRPKEVYGIELNKVAHRYAEQNIKLNKLQNVYLVNGDVKDELPKLEGKFDRIVMPLPKDSPTFLEPAVKKVKPGGMIHIYLFAREDEFEQILERYRKAFDNVELVKCGAYSPRVYRICLDLKA